MTAGPTELMAEARSGRTEASGELFNLYRDDLRMVALAGGLGLRRRALARKDA